MEKRRLRTVSRDMSTPGRQKEGKPRTESKKQTEESVERHGDSQPCTQLLLSSDTGLGESCGPGGLLSKKGLKALGFGSYKVASASKEFLISGSQ